jgi:hypothetical protein
MHTTIVIIDDDPCTHDSQGTRAVTHTDPYLDADPDMEMVQAHS